MLGVGILGAPFVGFIQDNSVKNRVAAEHAAIYRDVAQPKPWIFGQYEAVDPEKVKTLPDADKAAVEKVSDEEKKHALATVCIFPLIMVVSYLALLGYFKSKGGYQQEHLETEDVVAAGDI